MIHNSGMATETYKIVPFPLRMSTKLRDSLEESAELSGRSLNAEIVYRLETTMIKSIIIEFESKQTKKALKLKSLIEDVRDVLGVGLLYETNDKEQYLGLDVKIKSKINTDILKIFAKDVGILIKEMSEHNAPRQRIKYRLDRKN